MKKILFLPGPYGVSHTTRLWALAKRFYQENYKIAVCLNADQDNLGWNIGEIHKSPDFPNMESINVNIYELASQDLLEKYIKSELKAIENFKPDVIIADLRPTARLSATLSGIPLITLQNAALTQSFKPYHFFNFPNADSLEINFREKAIVDLATPFANLASKYKLDHLLTLFDFINGDLNWICDLESLLPMDEINQNIFYVGPLLLEESKLNTSLIPDIFKSKSKIVIYISLGNSGTLELIDLFIDAFKNESEVLVLLTIGLQQTYHKSGFILNNFYITNYINGAEILPFASLMIHHGGSGSMYQALKFQVPTIVLPINIEQKINAQAIENSQTGIVLDLQKLTAQHLLDKSRQVFSYRKILGKNLQIYSNQINEKIDIQALVEQINRLVN